MTPLYMQLDFPELPLEALGVDYQDLKIAVYAQNLVVKASPKATASGVLPGMTLQLALTLCPELKTLPAAPNKQRRLLYQLAHWAYQYSHQVAIRNQGLCIEIARSERLFGDPNSIQTQLRQACQSAARPVRMAFGNTPEMADVFLKQGICPEPYAFADTLKQSPLSATPIPMAQLKRLTNMGFRTLGDYLQMPSRSRQKRIPESTYRLLEAISGRSQTLLQWFAPAPNFQQSLEFLRGLETHDMLRFPMHRLVQDAERWLRQRQTATDRIQWHLAFERGHRETLAVRFNQPQWQADALFDSSWLSLCGRTLKEPITGLTLQIQELVSATPDRRDLFLKHNDSDRHRLLDRLRARLGEQAITTPCRLPDPRPEKANCCNEEGQHSAVLPALPPRPIWLVEPPCLIGTSPEASGHRLLQGPERIESGWWDAQPVCRKYWVSWYQERFAWIYQDQHLKSWWLAGWFT